MIRQTLMLAAILGTLAVHAQNTDSTARDSGGTDIYLGIQGNRLVRQILSFGSSAPVNIDNPFLLTFAANNSTTGHGFSLGLGYTFNEFKEGDNVNFRETTINDFAIRAGHEQKIPIAKRWILSWGIDALALSEKNTTVNHSDFGNQTREVETINKTNAFGLGPRFGIYFSISERILIGTEASYYFQWIKESLEINNDDPNTSPENDLVEDKFKRMELVLPEVLYLTFRL